MYNLTVVIAHTFFVGEEQWLVHNVDCEDIFTPVGRRFNPDPEHQKVFDERGFTLKMLDEIIDNPTDVLIQSSDFAKVFAKKTSSGYAVVITGAGDDMFIVTAIRYTQKEYRNAIRNGKFLVKDPFD